MTLVIAHRGASAAHPENTVAAFHGARALGADWVELDVRRTADGDLAVHHDAVLADGRALVDLHLADLPAHITDLAGALGACAGMGVNVEIKNYPVDVDFDAEARIVDGVLDVLTGGLPDGGVVVSCFHLPTLDRVRAARPDLPTAWLVAPSSDPARLIDQAAAAGHDGIHPYDALVDAAYVARAHDRGLFVNVWTVDDPGRMAELVELGVDGIVTNVPDVARVVIDDPRR